MPAYDSIIARLLALHPKRIDLSLDRVRRLLGALGHPERRVPPVIHVAGTNGKGSTIAFMRAMLEAAGRSVHVYTSPHLVRFNERFRIAEDRWSPTKRWPPRWRSASAPTAASRSPCSRSRPRRRFLLFSRNPADVLLLEVGLGGTARRHQRDRRRRSPASSCRCRWTTWNSSVTRWRRSPPRRLPSSSAACRPSSRRSRTWQWPSSSGRRQRVRAPLHVAGEHWNVHEEHGRLVYQDEDGLLDLPAPKLHGRHQFDNAGVAIATLRAAGLKLPDAAYRNRHRQGRLAGAHAASLARRAEGARADRQRAVARRRP